MPFHAPSSISRLPLVGPGSPAYNARAYRETIMLYDLAARKLCDPVSEAEASRLRNLTEEQKAAEFPLHY